MLTGCIAFTVVQRFVLYAGHDTNSSNLLGSPRRRSRCDYHRETGGDTGGEGGLTRRNATAETQTQAPEIQSLPTQMCPHTTFPWVIFTFATMWKDAVSAIFLKGKKNR